jgi:hypothetical protein
MVWLLKLGVAGNGPIAGPGGRGAAPHVATHCAASARAPSAISRASMIEVRVVFMVGDRGTTAIG